LFATIVRFDLPEMTSTEECAQLGRELATLLSTIPGFLAYIALKASTAQIAAVAIVEDRQSLDVTQQRCEQWASGRFDGSAAHIQPLGAGEIIAQRGL